MSAPPVASPPSGSPAPRSTEVPGEPNYVGEVGEPAVVEGVRGKWRVDPAYLATPLEGRTALLSPLDRLVMDRKRMAEIFEFDYQLEMYKPAAKRRWGYWALPILYNDRLVGKLDATADRESGVLRVDAVHEDEPFDRETGPRSMPRSRTWRVWLGPGARVHGVKVRRQRLSPSCTSPVGVSPAAAATAADAAWSGCTWATTLGIDWLCSQSTRATTPSRAMPRPCHGVPTTQATSAPAPDVTVACR